MIQEGSAAMARKDYTAAVDIYSKAIDELLSTSSGSSSSTSSTSSSNDNNPAVHKARLYSNRSIALFYLQRYKEAIADTEKAINYDPTFLKPRVTKAGSLEKLNKIIEAEAEYRAILQKDPNHTLAQENLDRLELIRQQREQRQQQYQQQQQGWNGTGLPPTAPRAYTAPLPYTFRPALSLSLLIHMLRIATFFCAVLYILPLGSLSYQGYYSLLLLSLVNHILIIFDKHGLPPRTNISFQAIAPWVQRVLMDVTLPSLLLPFIFYSTRPMPLALLAIALVDFYFASEWINKSISTILPMTSTIIQYITLPLSGIILSKPSDTVSRMRTDEYRNQLYDRLLYYEALMEIILGILLLIELIFPHRALLPTVMIWMGFNQKYLFNPYVRLAFSDVDRYIMNIVTSRFCPSIILKLYTYLKNFLYTRITDMVNNAATQQQQRNGGGPAAGGGGMMSQCVIM